MKNIHMTSMENELVEQYKNATNVDIRIRLHEKYSTNLYHGLHGYMTIIRLMRQVRY